MQVPSVASMSKLKLGKDRDKSVFGKIQHKVIVQSMLLCLICESRFSNCMTLQSIILSIFRYCEMLHK